MPYGSFLDSLPTMLFVGAHVLFLVVGIWAAGKVAASKAGYAWAFWLYAVSQVLFLAYFGGVTTMKMAVLLEQTLIVILVVVVATQRSAA